MKLDGRVHWLLERNKESDERAKELQRMHTGRRLSAMARDAVEADGRKERCKVRAARNSVAMQEFLSR